jgi:hypothetical protein
VCLIMFSNVLHRSVIRKAIFAYVQLGFLMFDYVL